MWWYFGRELNEVPMSWDMMRFHQLHTDESVELDKQAFKTDQVRGDHY
jgi:hypothetical protein